MTQTVPQHQAFVTVPSVTNETVRNAIALLAGEGLRLLIKENDLSYRPPEAGDADRLIGGQQPYATALVPPGYYVSVVLVNVPYR